MRTLFIAWQDPLTRTWLPIGRVTADPGSYVFCYTQGALRARDEFGFAALEAFPELDEVYESSFLFPLLANRVPPRSREDYTRYIEWLNMPANDDEPFTVLARSGGGRVTDTLEVFPCPERNADNHYQVHFFAHGLRYLPAASLDRINNLNSGESLRLMRDLQNEHDRQALVLRTAETYPGDMHLVGYCPRYLRDDAFQVVATGEEQAEVQVERVNHPPAPLHFRLLCKITAPWPDGFQPFGSGLYQPIVEALPGAKGHLAASS